MDTHEAWRIALDQCRASGFHVLSLESAGERDVSALLTANEPPLSVRAFAESWLRHAHDPWQILVQSAVTVHSDNMASPLHGASAHPLRSIINRAECAALVFGHASRWRSPDQWGYLLQLRHHDLGQTFGHIVLHPPAHVGDIAAAEHVLNLTLPPTYRQFLMLTNGMEIGPAGNSYVCGAGPQRATWSNVLANDWLACAEQHELAALWRAFQGVYAYERNMDQERGENTFLSDETLLIPFAYTYENWCFDRSHRDGDGEHPVLLWDHELREARNAHPNFALWFASEVETYLFG